MNRLYGTGVMAGVLIGALGVGGVDTALGEIINADHVDADAKWVAHVDLDAILHSDILDGLGILDEIEKELGKEIEAKLGLNVREDISGVTLYGMGEAGMEDDGVVIVYGAANLQAILEMIQDEAPDLVPQEHRGGLVYLFEDGNEAIALRTEVGAAQAREDGVRVPWTLIVSDSVEDRDSALDIVGGGPGGGNALAKGMGRGSLIFLSASDLDSFVGEHEGKDPGSKMLGMAEYIEFELSDSGDALDFDLAIGTKDRDTAVKLVGIANGLLGMAPLLIDADEDPEIAAALDILSSLTIRSSGATVSAKISFSADTLAAISELAQAGGGDEYNDDDDDDDKGPDF